MADTCLYNLLKPTECIAQRENPNVNDEHWVIMMYQCKFISCDKCTTLVRDVGNGGHCTCRDCGYIGNLCAFCTILV